MSSAPSPPQPPAPPAGPRPQVHFGKQNTPTAFTPQSVPQQPAAAPSGPPPPERGPPKSLPRPIAQQTRVGLGPSAPAAGAERGSSGPQPLGTAQAQPSIPPHLSPAQSGMMPFATPAPVTPNAQNAQSFQPPGGGATLQRNEHSFAG